MEFLKFINRNKQALVNDLTSEYNGLYEALESTEPQSKCYEAIESMFCNLSNIQKLLFKLHTYTDKEDWNMELFYRKLLGQGYQETDQKQFARIEKAIGEFDYNDFLELTDYYQNSSSQITFKFHWSYSLHRFNHHNSPCFCNDIDYENGFSKHGFECNVQYEFEYLLFRNGREKMMNHYQKVENDQ